MAISIVGHYNVEITNWVLLCPFSFIYRVATIKKHIFVCVCVSHSVMCDSFQPHGLYLPGFSVYGVFQARILEWVAVSFSRGSFWSRDQTWFSCNAGRFFTSWTTREALLTPLVILKCKHSFESPSSVQFSRSVESDSLRPHESQNTRPPCPSPTPGVHSNSCPCSQCCHPAISSSVIPFSSCPQSLPASGFFPMSQLFTWGGQSIGDSASASVLPMNTQDWSHLGWTGWISLQSKGLWRVFSNTTVQKHQFFGAQPSSQSNSHIHTWPQEKP